MGDGMWHPEGDDVVLGSPPGVSGNGVPGVPARAFNATRDTPVPPPPVGMRIEAAPPTKDARVAASRSGLATASLTLGIAVFVLFPFSLYGLLAVVPSLVVGVIALAKRARPMGFPIAGLVLTVLALRGWPSDILGALL